MSYFDKYLKYKTKYLALKDTVGGGEKPIYGLGDKGFEKLFEAGITKDLTKSVLLSKYPDIMDALEKYCWISPLTDDKVFDYGIGLFIFKKKSGGSYFSGFTDYGWSKVLNYAYWKIELHNIGPIIKLSDKSNNTETPFSTSIMLKSNQGENIPEGTRYGWNHEFNCWIYNNNNTFYKADLKLDFDWDDLSGFWNDNTTFEVTYKLLEPYFSDYCFVGQTIPENSKHPNKAFGIGFFLYKSTGNYPSDFQKYKFFNSHVSGNAKYAILYITQGNIGPITLNNKITETIYKASKGRKFNTTIPLELDNDKSLPFGTEYYWDHELNCWIYFDSKNKKYYSANFK
jgi:hypothetical protein